MLIKQGADVNAESPNQMTALMHAAFKGHSEVVEALLAKEGIDVNAKNPLGETALTLSASEGNHQIVKALLAKEGIDINAKDSNGKTALLCAAENGHSQLAEYLENYSVEADAKEPTPDTEEQMPAAENSAQNLGTEALAMIIDT